MMKTGELYVVTETKFVDSYMLMIGNVFMYLGEKTILTSSDVMCNFHYQPHTVQCVCST